MPWAPKPVCSKCRRRRCTCPPAAKPKVQPTRVRKSRQPDWAYRRLRDQLIENHLRAYGWWCPGAPDLRHAAHHVYVGHLDVDHINGDHDDNRPENLRVLCRAVNRGKKRVIDQVRRKRKGTDQNANLPSQPQDLCS